ncbi:uncharacterized protein F58A4.6 [Lucilia cuprina]|uniref:uncharacterized protein F58A4.6 n=1 Tax=Lucilia cuprina TaxID=7375 RepID=UPI001F06AAAC|nr:uncharacterized protein F58A4.6 [Lucilia cuprina]
MCVIICINDYWQHKIYYHIVPSKQNINNNNLNRIDYNLEVLQKIKRTTKCSSVNKLPVLKRLKWEIDGINYYYLQKELLNFVEYRKVLSTWLQLKGVQLLWLQIVKPERDIIDWKWNRMLAVILWEKIEIEYLMSWLSTLGGAFSALGEQFSKCAEMAGKISQKQLMIGIKLGDPFLQSRCKLFYSISLIQTGRLRSAKYIIRQQYNFARSHAEVDGRLVKMCKGIWLKLQYEYGLRLKSRKKEKELQNQKTNGAGDK